MFDKLIKVISIVIHPLLMPAMGFLILFNSGTYLSYLPFEAKKMVFLIVALCTIIIPVSFIPFFLYQKIILNIQMNHLRDRIIPLVITFLLYLFCYYLLKRIPIPDIYHAFIFGSTIVVFLALLITFKWKISAHMIGLGGIVGLIGFVSFYLRVNLQFYLILAILAAGLTGFARLWLNAHNPAQVYAGFFLGFGTMLITLYTF